MGGRERHAATRAAILGGLTAAGAYGAFVGLTYARFGRPRATPGFLPDTLLDRFMPTYDVVERHQTRVGAPAAVTYAAAGELDLAGQPLVRLLVRTREVIFGSKRDEQEQPTGLLRQVRSLGWGVLAEVPGREIVMGAVTKPWQANVTFRAVPPEEFATFAEPDHVKIAWTLRALPIGESASIFTTETRALATDACARAKFRWYWSLVSPGVWLIRRASLSPLRADAERRAAGAVAARTVPAVVASGMTR
jgi:hypothetical protein